MTDSNCVDRVSDVEAHAAALAGLRGMTPVRLAKLLVDRQPQEAWDEVLKGSHRADPRRTFALAARKTDVSEVAERYEQAGVKILLPDDPRYPSMLVGDPGAPAVLFAMGDPTVLDGKPRVAIVGTRSPTHYGRQVASELAGDLATKGVVVVSGLAADIDGAAHAGVVRRVRAVGSAREVAAPSHAAAPNPTAPPVAVVGTGLNIVYPKSNRKLWDEVVALGAVFSESALDTQPHPGVFPARNRIIAALSDVVVVVESQFAGGSLYTVEAAARRSIPVCAVPGSVHSRASNGTNALLVDGCIPVRDATDVLVAVSLAQSGRDPMVGRTAALQSADDPQHRPGASIRRAAPGRAPTSPTSPTSPTMGPPIATGAAPSDRDGAMTADQEAVLYAVESIPTVFETILIRTDLSIAEAAEACDQLTERGLLVSGAGWWSRS